MKHLRNEEKKKKLKNPTILLLDVTIVKKHNLWLLLKESK